MGAHTSPLLEQGKEQLGDVRLKWPQYAVTATRYARALQCMQMAPPRGETTAVMHPCNRIAPLPLQQRSRCAQTFRHMWRP